jgi:phosphate transport system substrate-binding protein
MNKTMMTLAAVLFAFGTNAAYARDTIRIVGSSTVYPFTTTVAENFGKRTGMPTPIVESTGTGGGFKLFCAGTGEDTPDAVNASRPIKEGEIETCKTNGVTAEEIKIGFDGIVLAMSKEDPDIVISTQVLYMALAKYVYVDGQWIENPTKTWNDLGSALPSNKIEVLGPPPTSGTRDSFVELVLEKECKRVIAENALTVTADDEKMYCRSMREDGAYVEAGENDNLIVQKLEANHNALGIFGYSFLEENTNVIKAVQINNVAPSFETIADGSYPISRPLFIYIKKEHIGVIPGIEEFVAELKDEGTIGEEGYLVDKGLIPLP